MRDRVLHVLLMVTDTAWTNRVDFVDAAAQAAGGRPHPTPCGPWRPGPQMSRAAFTFTPCAASDPATPRFHHMTTLTGTTAQTLAGTVHPPTLGAALAGSVAQFSVLTYVWMHYTPLGECASVRTVAACFGNPWPRQVLLTLSAGALDRSTANSAY